MSTQIRGNKQIQGVTITDAQIAENASIQTIKLAEGAELVKRDGSVPFIDNVDFGFNQIKNLGEPVDVDDAVRKSDLDEVAARVNGTLINRESVSGVKDGQNVTFNLLNTPTLGTEQIFLNGALLNAGANADYVISGSIITMTVAPQSGDIILANYIVDGIQINTDVQASLNQFNGRLTSVEGELYDAEVAIVQLGDADDLMSTRVSVTESDISALEVRTTNSENAISALQSSVAAEVSRAGGAEQALNVRLTTAEFEILGVKSRMTTAEGDISSLESADIDLDSRISTLEDGLQGETNSRISAVNSLNSRVTALENDDVSVDGRLDDVESDVSVLQSDLSSESATRLANDNTLQSNINTEIANRAAAVSAVQTNLNTEIADRMAAIVAEEGSRAAADAAIETDLENEIIRATAAEALLSGRLDDLEADSIPALETRMDVVEANTDQNTVDIGIEMNRALAAESALDARIDALETDPVSQAYVDQKIADLVNSAPAVLDTLKELSDAIGGDENFAATLSTQLNALDARLDSLESNPTTQTYVDAEVSAVDGRVDDLVADLAQEVLDRIADVNAEESRAMSAESALDSRIDALESAPPPVTALSYLSDVTVASPSNGQVLLYNGSEWVNAPAPSTFSGSYTDLTDKPAIPSPVREKPTGAINGTNVTFVLSQAPSVPNTEQVFVNGILQESGNGSDYTISGDTITFDSAPESGWKVIVYYFV